MISSDLKCFSRHDLAFTKSESDACRVILEALPGTVRAQEILPYPEQPDQRRAALHHLAPVQAGRELGQAKCVQFFIK